VAQHRLGMEREKTGNVVRVFRRAKWDEIKPIYSGTRRPGWICFKHYNFSRFKMRTAKLIQNSESALRGIELMAGANPALACNPPTQHPPSAIRIRQGMSRAKSCLMVPIRRRDADGNFIIGPTHIAHRKMTVQTNVPQGTVYDFTIEFGGQQNLSRHRAASRVLLAGGSHRPRQIGGDHQPSGSLHPQGISFMFPKQYVPGTVAPFIVGRTGPDRALFTALGQSDCREKSAGDDCRLLGNGSAMPRAASAGLEYDTMSGVYAESSSKRCCRSWKSNGHVNFDQGSRRPGDDGRQFPAARAP